MQWDRQSGTLEHGRWLLEPIEEWSQFLGGRNWYTFRPLMIEFEDDRMMGGVEATIVFLGLGLRWRWNWRQTELTQKLARDVADIKSGLIEAVPVFRPETERPLLAERQQNRLDPEGGIPGRV